MTHDDDRFEEALAGALPGDAPAEGDDAHPSADALAGLAEGLLPEEGRAAIEHHLAVCSECRAIAADLAGRGSVEVGAATAARGAGRWLPWAAAALVLIGVGAMLLWRRDGAGPARPGEDPDRLLRASAKALAEARPDLFAEFTPLDRAARTAPHSAALRGDVALHGPRGTVLTGRPAFRWAAVGRATRCTLTLRGSDGAAVWMRQVEGTVAPFPADAQELPPGSTWQWSIAGKRAAGPFEGSLGFHVASETEAARFAEVRRELLARVPAAQAEVLWAQWAAQAGLLEEAERALVGHLAAHPADPLGTETLDYVRARLGIGVR